MRFTVQSGNGYNTARNEDIERKYFFVLPLKLCCSIRYGYPSHRPLGLVEKWLVDLPKRKHVIQVIATPSESFANDGTISVRYCQILEADCKV